MRQQTYNNGHRNPKSFISYDQLRDIQVLVSLVISCILTLSMYKAEAQQVDFNVQQLSNTRFSFEDNVESRYRQYSDIWGWEASDSTPYAIIGCGIGTLIFLVADPVNPELVQIVPGAQSLWRDMKSHENYIYVVADEGADGLLIIDMAGAPDEITWNFWKPIITGSNGMAFTLQKCHNLYVADGYAYLAGCNVNGGGVVILDIHTSPTDPTVAGVGDPRYAHDVFVIDDRMYTSDLSAGFTITDVSNKSNPQALAAQLSSGGFTHNAWSSDDGQLLFTSDERSFATVDAYDVSNPDEIILLDRYRPQATLEDPVVPHNVHYYDGYLVVSFYTDGLKIIDANDPSNLVEVGSSDTYFRSSGGFDGLWGAYPYTSSGLIYGSDMASGLFIFDANYHRAAYLSGTVTDASNDSPLQNVTVRILSDLPGNASTSSDGSYKMGLGSEGMHMVRFFKEGFHIQEVAIDLRATEQIIQDIRLEPLEQYQISGTVIDDESGEPISLAQVVVLNDLYDERTATGQNGNFNLTSYEGDFVIAAGKWGHIHGTRTHTIGSDLSNMEIRMQTGYRDDFVFNYGWSVMSQGVSATTTRQWARGVPQGYTYDGNLANPEADIKDDFGRTCFVTGLEGTSAGNLGDTSTLFSPEFDISDYNDPYLNYYLWFFDDGVNPSDDVLEIYLSNGIIEVLIEKLSSSASEWRDRSEWRINDFLEPTDRMQLRIFAADAGNVHIYEAGLDGFSVTEGLTTSAKPENDKFSITLGPNPFNQVLHMYAPNHSIGVHYQIVNVMSQSLTQGIVLAKHTTIDTTLLPSGVHVLILRSTDGSIESRKLVKL